MSDAVTRTSTIVRRLRSQGATSLAERVEREAAAGPPCEGCGLRALDPLIWLAERGVVYGCPWCSSPHVFAQWEAEGLAERVEA